LLKFCHSRCPNKPAPLKKIEKIQSRISSLFFILKKNKKRGILFFNILQIPCQFQQNRPKKVAVGLNGLMEKNTCKNLQTKVISTIKRPPFPSDFRQLDGGMFDPTRPG
jgi:hypothetical protein